MTIGDLCTSALQRIGVLAAGETPSAEDMEVAIKRFNSVSDMWRAKKLYTFSLVRTTWSIVANDGSYSLGASADINIARPVYVQRIKVIDTAQDPDAEIDLGELLTDQEYTAISQKALTNVQPTRVHYNPTYPTGTVTFWPVPTSSSLQGVIYTPNATGTVVQTDTLSVPPGYQEFYETSLAIGLCPDFEREPSQTLKDAAKDAKTSVLMVNYQPLKMSCDAALVGRGNFNILTGQPN